MGQDVGHGREQTDDEDKSMKTLSLEWQTVHSCVQEILRQMQRDAWQPDYVVGLTRGGLVPAVMISHYLGVPMHALGVSLQDGKIDGCESNFWMAEDAFGYVPRDERVLADFDYALHAKKILIVDDINDTGATLDWVMQDWSAGCLPHDVVWDTVWGNNVRFAVLVDNLSSGCSRGMDYSGREINKAEDPQWVVFPWEAWWKL
jgi:xanthine phosphoribosyltransferase